MFGYVQLSVYTGVPGVGKIGRSTSQTPRSRDTGARVFGEECATAKFGHRQWECSMKVEKGRDLDCQQRMNGAVLCKRGKNKRCKAGRNQSREGPQKRKRTRAEMKVKSVQGERRPQMGIEAGSGCGPSHSTLFRGLCAGACMKQRTTRQVVMWKRLPGPEKSRRRGMRVLVSRKGR